MPLDKIDTWHKSVDAHRFATFLPDKAEQDQMKNIITHHNNNLNYRHLYVRDTHNRSTMLLNIFYYLYTIHKGSFEVVVIGSDMIYKKQGDTFYSHLPTSKATNDPVNKFTNEELQNELKNVENLYNSKGATIYNASTEKETKLAFKKFTKHL